MVLFFMEPSKEFVIVVNSEVISCICAAEKLDALVSTVTGLGVDKEGVKIGAGVGIGRTIGSACLAVAWSISAWM